MEIFPRPPIYGQYIFTLGPLHTPLELFLLFGDVYVGDGELGKNCHEKRVAFEDNLRRHGKSDTLNRFYTAMADLNLGRSAIVYATPSQVG